MQGLPPQHTSSGTNSGKSEGIVCKIFPREVSRVICLIMQRTSRGKISRQSLRTFQWFSDFCIEKSDTVQSRHHWRYAKVCSVTSMFTSTKRVSYSSRIYTEMKNVACHADPVGVIFPESVQFLRYCDLVEVSIEKWVGQG